MCELRQRLNEVEEDWPLNVVHHCIVRVRLVGRICRRKIEGDTHTRQAEQLINYLEKKNCSHTRQSLDPKTRQDLPANDVLKEESGALRSHVINT